MAGLALFAVPAVERQANDHVIARRHGAHFGPDLFDHARRLVATHGRQRMRQITGDDVEV